MHINTLDTLGYWTVQRYNPPRSSPVSWIDNTAQHLYIPSTPCKVEHSNIAGASTGRDESGIMHIDWVRTDVRKVYLHYNAITQTELNYMMDLLQGREFRFKFRDQGAIKTMWAYASESSYEFYSYSSAYSEGVYTNFEIHVIEL